jgi:hypothetical protein
MESIYMDQEAQKRQLRMEWQKHYEGGRETHFMEGGLGFIAGAELSWLRCAVAQCSLASRL